MSCGEPDFLKLAEAFGVKGILITERDQLNNGIKSALEFKGPVLVNVRVRRGENCYPMVPPGKSNACLLYTSPSPRDIRRSRMPSSA